MRVPRNTPRSVYSCTHDPTRKDTPSVKQPDNVIPLRSDQREVPDDGTRLDVTAAAQTVVDASRHAGQSTATRTPEALLRRDLMLDLWAALIGHPGDRSLALQHAYMIVLHGTPLHAHITEGNSHE